MQKMNSEEVLLGSDGGGSGGNLIIHAARYGWAGDIWNARLGSGHDHGGGAKDVTAIVRGDVRGDELHVNPQRAGQYMNRHFWPETSGGRRSRASLPCATPTARAASRSP